MRLYFGVSIPKFFHGNEAVFRKGLTSVSHASSLKLILLGFEPPLSLNLNMNLVIELLQLTYLTNS